MNRLNKSHSNFRSHYVTPCGWPAREERPVGLLPCQYNITDFLSTRGHFGTHSHCGTARHQNGYHPTVSVVNSSTQTMHSVAWTGAFPTSRHNEIQDLLATFISEVCYDTATEPLLQPLPGETFRWQTTTTDDKAHLDIRTRGFWGNQAENTFFDVNIFNPNAPSNRTSSLTSCYHRHEWAKRSKYEEQIREMERASFTPLVFNTSGGASPLTCTTTFLKHLASLLAKKQDLAYSTVLGWLRAWLNFSLLHAAITCICRSRSTVGHARQENIPDLAASETQKLL